LFHLATKEYYFFSNKNMKLDLRFTTRYLENIWCHTVVALMFQEPVCRGDGLSGLDVKILGYLTYLWDKDFWKGVGGETLLVASQNMIKADKILIKGLGAHSDYSMNVFIARIKETGKALEKMNTNDIGIRIPVVTGSEPEYPAQLEAACLNIVDPFLRRYKDDPEFILKLVVSVNAAFTGELESLTRILRKSFSSKLHYTIIIDNEKP